MATEKHPDPIIVTRGIVKRVWSDFEPKIVSGLASGTVATGALAIAESYGIHLPSVVANGLPFFCAMLAGYFTSSVGTVTTVRTGNGLVVEKHSGAVEIKTGAIPIQKPLYSTEEDFRMLRPSSDVSRGTAGLPPSQFPVEPKPVPAEPTPPADPQPYEVPDQNDSPGFTEVIQPETSRGSAILSQLPSSGGTRAAYYEDDSH